MKKVLQVWEEELQDSLDQKAQQETWVNTDVLKSGCVGAELNGCMVSRAAKDNS